MPRLRPAYGPRRRARSRHERGYTNDHARNARQTVDEHVARHGMVCPGYMRAAHPVRGVGSERLTGNHPRALVLGGSSTQQLEVLCQGCNTVAGEDARREAAELRASGYEPDPRRDRSSRNGARRSA